MNGNGRKKVYRRGVVFIGMKGSDICMVMALVLYISLSLLGQETHTILDEGFKSD